MKKTIVTLGIALAGLVAAGGGSIDAAAIGPSVTYLVDRSEARTIDPSIVHIDSVPIERDCPLTPGPFASKWEYLNAAGVSGGIPPQTDFC